MITTWFRATMIGVISILAITGCFAMETNKMDVVGNVCDLPEKLSAFEDYIADRYGSSIDSVVADKLEVEFNLVKDDITNDFIYSKTEKARLVGFSKYCTAEDGVRYKWQIAATINLKGNPIFHQLYMLYDVKDIHDGRRQFSFENTHADYRLLILKDVKGMNSDKVAKYMSQLGVEYSHSDSARNLEVYKHEVDFENNMASRISAWDFSRTITIKYNEKGVVADVAVQWAF